MNTPCQNSQASPYVLNVEGLYKRYGDLLALDGLSMHVPKGQIFGLLGPNASGKTTAINCILQLVHYEQGSVELFGQPMKASSYDLKRKIGIVPQDIAVLEELTVEENIDFFCSLNVPEKQKRKQLVQEALTFVELEDYARMRPKKLSGGLKRRLNIACGIAHKPELIFCDEPTVAVDPQSRNTILENISDLARAGATVIYTTHYMEEVEQICDHVMIMDHGRILAEGTTQELKAISSQGERISCEVAQMPKALLGRLRAEKNVVSLTYSKGQLELTCTPGEHNLATLLGILAQAHVEVGRVYSEPPTLNDVFLELTGRELRD